MIRKALRHFGGQGAWLRIAAVVCLVLALLLPLGQASAVIPLPHAFYGTLLISGEPAPSGTVVTAKVKGQVCGSITTEYPGKYGSDENGNFGVGILKLIVQGDGIDNGDIVEFYVQNAKANQTCPFASGEVTPLNLTYEGTPVVGVTREVNGDLLPYVGIMLDDVGPEASDADACFWIMATATGNHGLFASKNAFRDRAQTIDIAGLGPLYTVTCNFQGKHGLIPNAPNIGYAMQCVNLWLFPPNPEIGLDIGTAMEVVNAWLYPIVE